MNTLSLTMQARESTLFTFIQMKPVIQECNDNIVDNRLNVEALVLLWIRAYHIFKVIPYEKLKYQYI